MITPNNCTCGADAKALTIVNKATLDYKTIVICTECAKNGGWYYDKEEAIEAWNKEQE